MEVEENQAEEVLEDKKREKSNQAESNPNLEVEEEEEGRTIKGAKRVYLPSKDEWDNHMRSHIPFRRWCAFCVKGRCKSGAHVQTQKSEEDLEKEVPKISVDYMEPRSAEGKKEEVESLPILAGIDSKAKWHTAVMDMLWEQWLEKSSCQDIIE